MDRRDRVAELLRAHIERGHPYVVDWKYLADEVIHEYEKSEVADIVMDMAKAICSSHKNDLPRFDSYSSAHQEEHLSEARVALRVVVQTLSSTSYALTVSWWATRLKTTEAWIIELMADN